MDKRFQLFCFTYAGGAASFFDGIKNILSFTEVLNPDYSGHGRRLKEQFYNNIEELADDMFSFFVDSYSGGEYALFGYSMGTITVVEVLKRIINSGINLPNNVFLAAHEPKTRYDFTGYSEDELNDWVKRRTISFGAIPDQLKTNSSFWRFYLPILKADYSIIGKYSFDTLSLETEIPLTVFYSENDTPYEEIQGWKKFFLGDCDFYNFDGNHFFFQSNCNIITRIIENKLRRLVDDI